jgi:glutamate-ammonia-ligase adenylyltransferase
MALTRARVIHGEPSFVTEVEAMLKRILTMKRDPVKLATDILEMRQRMLQQFRGDNIWDLKQFRGGQVDIDFIAQFLQLRHAATKPEILQRNPTDALAQARDLHLIEPGAADGLIETARLWRKLQQMLRLLASGKIDEATLPEPTKRRLAGIAGCGDFAGLKQLINGRAAQALGQFDKIIRA